MIFNRKPRYAISLRIDISSKEELLSSCIIAIQRSNWDVRFVSESQIQAYTRISMASVSEEVSINVSDSNNIQIQSRCRGFQLIDWGKNKANVTDFESERTKTIESYSTQELIGNFERMKQKRWKIQPIT